MLRVMNKQNTKVVVVGGGFGGVKTALNLMNKPGFDVQLISDNTHFQYHGALYRSAVGHSPMEVVIPLKEIFKDANNVELVLDSASVIDAQKNRIASATGNIYSYDKAVFALGSTVNSFNIPGMQDHTVTMHDIPSTIKLRKELIELFKKRQKQAVRIAIIGAGASGVELAGEIPYFAQLIAKKYRLPKPKLKVILIDASDRILPMLSPQASEKTKKRLQSLGVEIHLNIGVESCSAGLLCMTAGNLQADLVVWTAGSKPVDFYAQNPSVFPLGRGGRVVVNESMNVAPYDNLYVLGDNADTPYSGMAQTALHDAKFITHNLLRQKKGAKEARYYVHRPLYVVTAGPKWAVTQQGASVRSGYRAWLTRRQADLEIFKNFTPYEQAIKTWRQANKRNSY